MVTNWYSLESKEVLRELKTNENGLTHSEAIERLKKHGPNELKEVAGVNPLKIFLEQFKNFLIIILLVAAITCLFIGKFIDFILILVIVIANGIFGFVQDYKAEKSIQALKKLAAPKAKVLREGIEAEIDASEIVPGDIILLEEGEKVPADARLIQAFDLKSDESVLTGESLGEDKGIKKLKGKVPLAERTNMVFMHTNIVRGRGKAVIVSTGPHTEVGKIATQIQTIPRSKTHFQKKLGELGKKIGIMTLFICLFIFLFNFLILKTELLDTFLVAVSLAVAAIPEGLPAIVTLSLALGTTRMVKKNALVRKLPAAEALGAVDIICADKTGTITSNQMTVRKIYLGKEIEVGEKGFHPKPKGLEKLLRIGLLCNNAEIDKGDPTEKALVVSAAKFGLEKKVEEKKYKRLDEIPFSSERKLMTTVHLYKGKKFVFTKGAVSSVLKICNKIYLNGKILPLNKERKNKVLKAESEFASKALRVLGFAWKKFEGKPEKNLIFMGLQAMMDPPRKGVKDSIQACKKAGIRVIMITGDNKLTAEAIAKDIGLEGNALTGTELNTFSKEELKKKIEEISIFARIEPRDKVKVLEALKAIGHSVAMTGDGVNDAPALKASDIGVAMGLKGTDVAKESSEMILLDDNFVTIERAVKEGRIIFDNVRKFVNYLLSCNVGEVLVVFLASVFMLGLPLTAVHLLWINLLTDGMPALALGVDPGSKDIMKRKPRKKEEGIINKRIAFNIGSVGAFIGIICLLFFWFKSPSLSRAHLIEAQTVVFTALVVFELVRLQGVRSRYKLSWFSNKYLILAVIASLALQLLVLYTPINHYFGVVPLGLRDWSIILIGMAGLFGLTLVANKIGDKFFGK